MGSRARGQLPVTIVDGQWPYQVEIIVPERGLLGALNTMEQWMRAHAPPPASHRRGGASDVVQKTRFAFAVLETAEAFQAAFGGELLDAGEKNSQSQSHRDPAARPLRKVLFERRLTDSGGVQSVVRRDGSV